jgi:hypothetical protein
MVIISDTELKMPFEHLTVSRIFEIIRMSDVRHHISDGGDIW